MGIKHRFVSNIVDNPNLPDMLRPSNWNDNHDIENGAIREAHIDFGLSAGQINTDNIPEGPFKKYTRSYSFFNAVLLKNASASSITIGTPVYKQHPYNVYPAQANTSMAASLEGLSRKSFILPNENGLIQRNGMLRAPISEWALVVEHPGGLLVDEIYYLSWLNPGKITNVAPSQVGDFIVQLGVAKTSEILDVDIRQPIEII